MGNVLMAGQQGTFTRYAIGVVGANQTVDLGWKPIFVIGFLIEGGQAYTSLSGAPITQAGSAYKFVIEENGFRNVNPNLTTSNYSYFAIG